MRRFCLFLLSTTLVHATTSEDVLGRLDQAAAKFSGISAELSRVTYTKVIDDTAQETGSMLLRKSGPKDLRVLIDFTKPDAKTVAFSGGKAEIYYPKMKTVQEYDLGKQSGLVDQFLLVGFGTTGKELKSAYTVKYIGEETIGGQKAQKLELTPTTTQLKDKLRKVELWIADAGAYPVQQKFIQPSGDYYLFTYTGVKLNPATTEESLKLKVPKGVKREKIQK